MTSQPIPPYTEADERAAREAFDRVRLDEREGLGEQLVREVAGAIATARAEGYEAGVHEGRSDALDVIERMLGSNNPEAIIDALPRVET